LKTENYLKLELSPGSEKLQRKLVVLILNFGAKQTNPT
jgi:hypothetical protein